MIKKYSCIVLHGVNMFGLMLTSVHYHDYINADGKFKDV